MTETNWVMNELVLNFDLSIIDLVPKRRLWPRVHSSFLTWVFTKQGFHTFDYKFYLITIRLTPSLVERAGNLRYHFFQIHKSSILTRSTIHWSQDWANGSQAVFSHFWQSSCLPGTQYHICPLQNAIFTSIYQRPEVLEALLDHFRSPRFWLVEKQDGPLWLVGCWHVVQGGGWGMMGRMWSPWASLRTLASQFWDPWQKISEITSGLDENQFLRWNLSEVDKDYIFFWWYIKYKMVVGSYNRAHCLELRRHCIDSDGDDDRGRPLRWQIRKGDQETISKAFTIMHL